MPHGLNKETKYNSLQTCLIATCNMGPNSITCHLAEVIFRPLHQIIKAGTQSSGLEGLSCLCLLQILDRVMTVVACHTGAESFDNAGGWLDLVQSNRWLLCWAILHKLQLSSQCAVSTALRCWLHKLVKRITTVAMTRILPPVIHSSTVLEVRNNVIEWWDAGVAICLGWGADLHMAHQMPLGDFTFWISPWLRLKSETKP